MKLNFISIVLFWLLLSTNSLADNSKLIRLATTTSTDNSGLLDKLLPVFEKKSGYKVHVIAVGTGKALRLGKDGDVDVVLVHARKAEQQFVDAGYGEKRHAVMYNDFVLVGPQHDPAKVSGVSSIADGFRQISQAGSIFISRGDNSGTHKKELSIWGKSGITPEGSWYREVGQGMGKVLQMANELDAYTLTDRGTWLAYQSKVSLKIIYQGDKLLYNPYGIIAVNPKRFTDINYQGATALINWITSATDGQPLIADFRIKGQQLFTPMAE